MTRGEKIENKSNKYEVHRLAHSMAGKLYPPVRKGADLRALQTHHRAAYQGQDRRHGAERSFSANLARVYHGIVAQWQLQNGQGLIG